MIDERAMVIADDAARGFAPAADDVAYLLGFDPYSVEAAYVVARAREVGMRACGGRGYIFAQIGVDAGPCPVNCRFCAFAECNSAANREDNPRPDAGRGVSIGRIVHAARLFDREGVDLVSLMATAGLGFDRYLDIVRAVRSSISEEVAILANVGDVTIEQAHALREAGVVAAYHAVRVGEGEVTGVDPLERKRTMRYFGAAGIKLMTGVEPLWEDADVEDIAQIIMDIPKFSPFCIGACSYTPTGVSSMEGRVPASTGAVRYTAAILRLVCGCSVPIGGIGGVAWVDAGADPRNRGYASSDEALAFEVARARKRLVADGFACA